MNSVILIGNLTKDPQVGKTSNGISYCKFAIAVTRDYKDNNGNRETDFFNCSAWRALAENIGKYCVKGSKVCVIGTLQNRTYEDKHGNKKTVTEILAVNVEFLSMKSKSETDEIEEGLDPVDYDGDLPF